MGGSGKTTLARKIFNHKTIEKHFKWKAWVSVSQEWNAQYILSEISRQVNKQDAESWRIEKLIEELHCFLQDKAYLIVLDDIWQKEALAKILPALPLGKTGSKIIVTSRNDDIVHLTDLRCTIYNPPKLTVQQSWELFSKVAFPNGNFPNFDDFEVLAKQMLERCDGLPLAIVSLGGLLSRKGSLNEWENVKAAVSSNIMASSSASHQYKIVRDILELSYRELPYQLKSYFLYLGLFPEDMEISVSMLKRMWIAEGFITRDIGSGVTLEDMASQHMEELIQRYMIQVGRRNRRGVVKTCRIHDLMRDLCITKGKEQGFLEVFSTDATSRQSTLTKSRRLAIHLRVDHTLPTQDLHVRSLLVNHDSSSDFAQKTMMVKELAAAFKKCKFLRVLQLCNIQLANDEKALPEEIGQLIFLRYLEIRNSSIYEIPQSISNLCMLLTFDYGVDRDDAQIRIPSDVFNKMERLVYLRFPYRNPIRVLTTSASGATSKIELNGLKSLQTLWGISSKSFRGLEHLSCLKELKIVHVASMEEMDAVWQCPSIKMDRLCKLNLQWEDNVEAQSLEPISHCRHLTLLTLRGRLCMLSNLPYNLSELRLYQSRLRQDSIPALGNLHHLRWLTMCYGAYADAKMIIRGDAFPQLVTLLLGDLIEEILLGSPAMPQIQWLFLHPSQWITYEPNSSFPEMKVVLVYLPEM
ncbi:hypothetical protein Ancab_001170 [Ancistrocladus abbreviatus]